MFQCSRYKQELGFNGNRLTVCIHLVKVELNRFFEGVGRQCTGSSGQDIAVTVVEQCLAVTLGRILKQTGEKELVNQSCRSVTHGNRNFHKGVQIIIDNHFSGQAELFTVSFQTVGSGFFQQTAVLDFAICCNREQVTDIRQAETLGFFEIIEISGRTEFGGDDRLSFVTLKQLFVCHIGKNARKRNGTESGADSFVVKTTAVGNAVKFHTLHHQLLEWHIHFTHTRFHGLRSVGFFQCISRNTDTQTHCSFKSFTHFTAFRFAVNGNVDAGGGAFRTESFKDFFGHHFRRPSGRNCLLFNFREFPGADCLDFTHSLTLCFDRSNSGVFCSCRNVSFSNCLDFLRLCRALIFFQFRIFCTSRFQIFVLVSHDFSFVIDKVKLGGNTHFCRSIRANRHHGNFSQNRFLNMVKRTVNGLTVDFTGAFYQLTLPDIRTDRELPISTRFGLRHNILGIFAVGNDFTGDFQSVIFDAGRNHSDSAVSFVFVVRK